MEFLGITFWVGDGEVVVAIVKAAGFVVILTKSRGLNPEFRKTSRTSWLTEELPTGLLFIINRFYGDVVSANGAA